MKVITELIEHFISSGELDEFEARGFGGSDMTPGMNRLAEDPEVERAIVLTDGDIQFPREGVAYEVLGR